MQEELEERVNDWIGDKIGGCRGKLVIEWRAVQHAHCAVCSVPVCFMPVCVVGMDVQWRLY